MAKAVGINANGGKASKINGRCTELPPLGLLCLSEVMGEGEEAYPRDRHAPNWHKVGCIENLDHCLSHTLRFLAMRNNDTQNNVEMKKELSHCAARAVMALEQFIREGL